MEWDTELVGMDAEYGKGEDRGWIIRIPDWRWVDEWNIWHQMASLNRNVVYRQTQQHEGKRRTKASRGSPNKQTSNSPDQDVCETSYLIRNMLLLVSVPQSNVRKNIFTVLGWIFTKGDMSTKFYFKEISWVMSCLVSPERCPVPGGCRTEVRCRFGTTDDCSSWRLRRIDVVEWKGREGRL